MRCSRKIKVHLKYTNAWWTSLAFCRVKWLTQSNLLLSWAHKCLLSNRNPPKRVSKNPSYCHKVAALHSNCCGKEHWKEKWVPRGNSGQMQGKATYIIYDHKICSNKNVCRCYTDAHLPPTPAFAWIRMYKLLSVYNLVIMPQFQHIKSTSAVQPVRIDED